MSGVHLPIIEYLGCGPAENAHKFRRACFESRGTLARVERACVVPQERFLVSLNRNVWAMEELRIAYIRRKIIVGPGAKSTQLRLAAYLRRWAVVNPWVFPRGQT